MKRPASIHSNLLSIDEYQCAEGELCEKDDGNGEAELKGEQSIRRDALIREKVLLTNSNRQVFSLNDPTQPANPMQNMKTPTSTKINAGSKNKVPPVIKRPKLTKVSFSIHA